MTIKEFSLAPELHIAFECEKEIMTNRQEIWGQKSFDWIRERKFKNYGYADLVFESDSTKYIIEFKVLQTIDAYIKDIEKLKKLKTQNFEKMFCAILCFFKHQKNEHINKLAELYGNEIKLILKTPPIETWGMSYTKKIYYSTVIWKILN